MARTGTIYTYTIVHSAAEEFKDKTPYVVALVEEGGQRVMSLLDNYSPDKQVAIGMTVTFSHEDAAQNPVYRLP